MRVLLIADCRYFHVGGFFSNALQQLDIDYQSVDEYELLEPFFRVLPYRLAYKVLRQPVNHRGFNRKAIEVAQRFRPQVVLLAKGAWIAPKTLVEIKATTGAILVNYATDDPFNRAVSTPDLVAGIPCYDLYVCTKRAIMEDVKRAGCRNVTYVPFGYEPHLHFPEAPATDAERERFRSDVLFIGAADGDRYPILRDVAAIRGLRLHLYGGYWDRDPVLRPFYRGLVFGREYRLALSGTNTAICLVRRANRDGHVMRSFETPACGAFMLAERTEEHLSFFVEGEEMACFGSNDELVDKIRYYLSHEADRQRIAQAGYEKVTSGKHTYRDRLQEILKKAVALK
jgi:spore maturation protein CgeB